MGDVGVTGASVLGVWGSEASGPGRSCYRGCGQRLTSEGLEDAGCASHKRLPAQRRAGGPGGQ